MTSKRDQYIEYVKDISEIVVKEFIEYPNWVTEVYINDDSQPIEIATIDNKVSNIVEKADWLLKVLNSQGLQDNFYLGFSSIPCAEIIAPNNSEWIQALLQNVNRGLLFLSLDKNKMLFINKSETYQSNDCYVAYLYQKPD